MHLPSYQMLGGNLKFQLFSRPNNPHDAMSRTEGLNNSAAPSKMFYAFWQSRRHAHGVYRVQQNNPCHQKTAPLPIKSAPVDYDRLSTRRLLHGISRQAERERKERTANTLSYHTACQLGSYENLDSSVYELRGDNTLYVCTPCPSPASDLPHKETRKPTSHPSSQQQQ